METLGIHAHGHKSVVFNGLNFVRDDKGGYYHAHEIGRSKPWLLHRYVMFVAGIEIGKNCEVHHIDGDKSNNLVSNLEVMSISEHKRKHAESMSDELRQKRRDNFLTKAIPSARAWHKSEEGRAWHVQHGRKVAQAQSQVIYDCVCKCCKNHFQNAAKKSDFCSNACKAKYRRDIGADDIEATCSYCGHTFKRNKYALRKKLEKGEKVFCSVRCATRDLGDRRHEDFVKEQAKNPPPPKTKKLKWFETEEGLEKHRRDMAMREKKVYTHVCKVCGETYTNNSKNSSVCSTKCKQRAAFERGTGTEIAVCEICGEKYKKRKVTVSHTCSRKCRGEYTRRKKAERKLAKMKEEQEKMSEKMAQGEFALDYERINVA